MGRKIAFVTFGHWASTIALAKHMTECDCSVDIYVECFRKNVSSLEATDIHKDSVNGIMGHIEAADSQVKSRYCPLVNFYYLRLISPMVDHTVLRKVSNLINAIIIKYICYKINMMDYDSVILVGRYNTDHLIYYNKYLRSKVFTCLHEVCNHQSPDYDNVSPLLQYLFKNKKQIVVHSDNCYNSIIKYRQVSIPNIHKLYLGLSETWRYVHYHDLDPFLKDGFESNYVLLIGGIDKYKGLKILLDTIRQLNDEGNRDIRYIIAGNGTDPCLDELRKIDNVFILNRFLDNCEFAYLVNNCRCIICPYQSMSQSGIPLAAFTLNKPLIVSRLEGFEEFIKDGEDGLLCDKNSANDFAVALHNVFNDDVYKRLRNNIGEFAINHSEHTWESIVKKYFDMIYC